MTTILQILVSPRPNAFSRRIAREVTARLVALHPRAELIERDLAADPPPHPDLDLYEAILTPTVGNDDPRYALSERLIGELEASDFVVIGTPMNNFSVPSTLKSWIDHIVRIRRTFRSSPEGKIGTLRDRPTFVVTAHGGPMSGGYQPDFLTPYLRVIFETIGIRQLEFFCADALSRGPESVARAFDQAKAWIDVKLPRTIR
ncbi:MAG TPA: NAD(P)H-dependent oxidoreductase [Stellaceae bacterium]|nr:NAD(P)H-dependent oxidoreductase [Stellaceae bacterium]